MMPVTLMKAHSTNMRKQSSWELQSPPASQMHRGQLRAVGSLTLNFLLHPGARVEE